MSLRTRLVLLVAGSVAVAVTLVTWAVSSSTRRAFVTADEDRTTALVAQFRREFAREGEEVVRRLERIAASDLALRVAIDVTSPGADSAAYVNEAAPLAAAHGLDFLDLVSDAGTIVSSAHWPARFGYRHPWLPEMTGRAREGAFLQPEELQGGTALALVAVRTVRAGDRRLYVAGGRRLDRAFLASLVLPPGMRVLLYRNLEPGFAADHLVDASGPVREPTALEPLIARVRSIGRETIETIEWPDGPERFQAAPLRGRGDSVPAVLLVGSSRRDLARLLGAIRDTGLIIGGLGVLAGVCLSFLIAALVTRPIEKLADGARAVAAGDWDARVEVGSSGEIGELATAFNRMTAELVDQRERLVQAERVAAWRDIGRRLAHELKNPLFPLRITVENLQRAKAQAPEQFEEVFVESTRTLLAELSNLNGIVARFADFARMPAPHFEAVRLEEVLGEVVRLFDNQLARPGAPPIEVRREVEGPLAPIRADPEQLGRALRNLVANAIEAMPDGGTLTLRARRRGGRVLLEVADTGEGLSEEARARLFTPYHTTKRTGTGLGLAIVQSIVSDHRGKIAVESERGRGTTFHIELPA